METSIPQTAPKAYLSRRYRLSASHRLHSDAFSEERNRAVYGKCDNPYGHGHNYVVEVTLGGPSESNYGDGVRSGRAGSLRANKSAGAL